MKLLKTKTYWASSLHYAGLFYIYEGKYFDKYQRYCSHVSYIVNADSINEFRKQARAFIRMNNIKTLEEFREMETLFKLQVIK